jgi:hypothetical protein
MSLILCLNGNFIHFVIEFAELPQLTTDMFHQF